MSRLPAHVDIHLIRILYLLLSEKNVSRVALKLNQPQPSISASLRKLRELTGDPLLVRGARGMVPTQHGESLLKPAKRILDETERPVRAQGRRSCREEAPHLPHRRARLSRHPVPAQRGGGACGAGRRTAGSSSMNIGRDIDHIRLLSDGDLDLVIANWDEPPPHLHSGQAVRGPDRLQHARRLRLCEAHRGATR